MAKKKWSQLSKRTQQRYTRAGVTWRDYNANRITPLQREKATGKRAVSFAEHRAKAHGLFDTIPREQFRNLPTEQRQAMIDAFNTGYGAPRTPFESSIGPFVPTSTERYPWIPDSQIIARTDANGAETYFRDYIDFNGKHRVTPLPNYGRAIAPFEEHNAKRDFQRIVDDYEMDYSSEWNDAIRDALEASSGGSARGE